MPKHLQKLIFFTMYLNMNPLAFGGEETQPFLYRSAYFLGRGHTGIATADNEDAIFYNPAGIAQGNSLYKKTILASPFFEISDDTKNLIREAVIEKNFSTDTLKAHIGKPQHFGFNNFTGVIFRRAALGLFGSTESDILVYKDPNASALEAVKARSQGNAGMTFTLADNVFFDNLYLGVTAYYLYRGEAKIDVSLSEYDSLGDNALSDAMGYGLGTGADVGLMYAVESGRHGWNLGLTIKNLGDTSFASEVENLDLDPLLQTVNVGFAYKTTTHVSKMQVFADFHDATNAYGSNTFLKSHLGVELNVKNFIGFTGGVNQGYLTGGCFLNIYFLRLDIGGYGEEAWGHAGLRPDYRYYMRIAGGF